MNPNMHRRNDGKAEVMQAQGPRDASTARDWALERIAGVRGFTPTDGWKGDVGVEWRQWIVGVRCAHPNLRWEDDLNAVSARKKRCQEPLFD
jgi:hypothetical protein